MTDTEMAVHQPPHEHEKRIFDMGESGHKQGQANQDGIDGPQIAQHEEFLITFGPGDLENPLNWSKKIKWAVTASLSGMGFVRIMVSTVCLCMIK